MHHLILSTTIGLAANQSGLWLQRLTNQQRRPWGGRHKLRVVLLPSAEQGPRSCWHHRLRVLPFRLRETELGNSDSGKLKKTFHHPSLSSAISKTTLLILVANFARSGFGSFLYSGTPLTFICLDEGSKVTGPTPEAHFSCHFRLFWLILLSHRRSHMPSQSL